VGCRRNIASPGQLPAHHCHGNGKQQRLGCWLNPNAEPNLLSSCVQLHVASSRASGTACAGIGMRMYLYCSPRPIVMHNCFAKQHVPWMLLEGLRTSYCSAPLFSRMHATPGSRPAA
jgi:hypothetical protein